MSEHRERSRPSAMAGRITLFGVVALLAGLGATARAGGPIDLPKTFEPRVEAGMCLSAPGLLSSKGNFQPYGRVAKDEVVFTRDLLVALPGFKIELTPANKNVSLTLWGNLPELSRSPVLESAVRLHDTKAFDLDFTFIRGRVVLTNTRDKGSAKIWLRAEAGGIRLTLPEPGDSVAIDLFGRWPAGEPFSLKRKSGEGPVRLWEAHCLKGKLYIKAADTEWSMSAAPGRSYFQGDSVSGPTRGGPKKRDTPPEWADPKAETPALAAIIKAVVKAYAAKVKDKDIEEIPGELLALAAKEKSVQKAHVMRQLAIHALIAADEPVKVAELLGESKVDEVRQTAVIGLRHWIGASAGRDEKLYSLLQGEPGYSKGEAETILQLLHSPFDRNQAETYETLIAYLKHRKQAIRELAHWHLVRLAPAGRDIAYDAAAAPAERNKAADAWKKLIPDGELPPEKKDGTKTKK